MKKLLLALLLLSLLPGCNELREQQEMEPLRVWLTDIEVLSLGIPEQKYRVKLRFQNPNSLPLPVRGLNLHLHLNQIHLAYGVSNQSIGMPSLSEATVEMEVSSRALGLAEAVQAIKPPIYGSLLYELEGRVLMANDIPPIPFAGNGYLGVNPEPSSNPTSSPTDFP